MDISASSSFTLGILGGGQLGRMSAIAAAQLGISVIILCPEENSPASKVAKHTIIAAYDDKDALKSLSEQTDIISYEFENIPVQTIEYLESLKPKSVLPEKTLLHVSQDRIKEKQFLNENGIETARWKYVKTLDDIKSTAAIWNADGFILKTTRFGYDGKGQIKCDTNHIENDLNLEAFLEDTKDQDIIMEDLIDFSCEISVVMARDKDKKSNSYGPMLNDHRNHILHTTTVPSGVSKKTADQALDCAQKIADAVNLTGVLTVEYFVRTDGSVLVNEIAPRTHNSGHWTIDACAISQFENHVRTVCGLPVGSTQRHSDAQMLNLIGDDINNITPYLNDDNACVHLYGKKDARAGRKMGHITTLKSKTS